MRRMTVKTGAISALICLMLVSQLLGQNDHVKSLKSQLASIEAERGKSVGQRTELFSEADQLAIEIEKLKKETKAKRSLFVEYKLKELLKKSTTLSDEISDLNLTIAKADTELIKISSDLVIFLDDIIAELVLRIEQSDDTKLDEKLFQEALRYREERGKLFEKYLASQEFTDYELPKIEIDRYDGPLEINEKTDLINDHLIKLNRELAYIDKNIGKLEDEKALREKMQEFMAEIALFDEGLKEKSANPIVAETPSSSEPGLSKPGNDNPVTAGAPSQPVGYEFQEGEIHSIGGRTNKIETLEENLGGLSLQQIDIAVASLKVKKQKILDEIHALEKKAAEFHIKSEELRSSLEQKQGE